MTQRKGELVLNVGISGDELVTALQAISDEDREWFLENLLAATSPDYLESIKEARKDYQGRQTLGLGEVFKD